MAVIKMEAPPEFGNLVAQALQKGRSEGVGNGERDSDCGKEFVSEGIDPRVRSATPRSDLENRFTVFF